MVTGVMLAHPAVKGSLVVLRDTGGIAIDPLIESSLQGIDIPPGNSLRI
jgi:hypothetical protein